MGEGQAQMLTIGHSNHEGAVLLGLLNRHDIEVVVDVRSAPYSRHKPQHNREAMAAALDAAGIAYVHLGAALGGRPREDSLYDPDGHVRYDLLARTDDFSVGIDRLLATAHDTRTAVLCAEEDPTGCHRRILVGRALQARGVEVQHIRGDGRLQADHDLDRQMSLFDPWRSIVAVRRP